MSGVRNTFEWPLDLPPGCPPAEAVVPDLVVYRLVRRRPLTTTDFIRPIDLPRKAPIPEPERCDYCALSLFEDVGDISLARQFIPGFDKKLVARGELSAEHGVVKRDPVTVTGPRLLQSHHNWWIPLNVDALPLFEIVDI